MIFYFRFRPPLSKDESTGITSSSLVFASMNGFAISCFVGFDDLGCKDDFPTQLLEDKIRKGFFKGEKNAEDGESDDDTGSECLRNQRIRSSQTNGDGSSSDK